MNATRPKQMKRDSAVWVWDGSWWPAVVAAEFIRRGERLLIVRLEHGISAPARLADLEVRDPVLRGTDKPSSALNRLSAASDRSDENQSRRGRIALSGARLSYKASVVHVEAFKLEKQALKLVRK